MHVSKSLLMFASFLVITWKVFEDSKLYSNMMHTDAHKVSNFGGMWNFRQEVASWRYWRLLADNENELQGVIRNFDRHYSQFTISHFDLSPFLANLLIVKLSFTIISPFKRQKLFVYCQVEFEQAETTWQLR